MKESVIEAKMHRLCFGDETCDIDFLSYADQFLLGLNKFEGMYSSMPHESAPLDSNGEVLVLSRTLHRQDATIFVGNGSIQKDLLIKKAFVA